MFEIVERIFGFIDVRIVGVLGEWMKIVVRRGGLEGDGIFFVINVVYMIVFCGWLGFGVVVVVISYDEVGLLKYFMLFIF